MPSTAEFYSLLRLLDDDTPQVRQQVRDRLRDYGGDVSEVLVEYPHPLTDSEIGLLSDLLKPCRRDILAREWQVPFNGWIGMEDDWDLLESSLRLISDFLHDGVTLRPPLSDLLDILAEEAQQAADAAGLEGLRLYLFESGRFRGNHVHYNDPLNCDLAWAIQSGTSNPLGLSTIFILVARRLHLVVEGVNFPGHFLCRMEKDGKRFLVDCFNGGRLHDMQEVVAHREDIDEGIMRALSQASTPGEILLRTIRNLEISLQKDEETEDAELIQKLVKSMLP